GVEGSVQASFSTGQPVWFQPGRFPSPLVARADGASLHPFARQRSLLGSAMKLAATRAVLLRRRGLVFVEGGGAALAPADRDRHLQALEIEWAALGHVPSTRLRARLAELSPAALGEVHRWVC